MEQFEENSYYTVRYEYCGHEGHDDDAIAALIECHIHSLGATVKALAYSARQLLANDVFSKEPLSGWRQLSKDTGYEAAYLPIALADAYESVDLACYCQQGIELDDLEPGSSTTFIWTGFEA